MNKQGEKLMMSEGERVEYNEWGKGEGKDGDMTFGRRGKTVFDYAIGDSEKG